MLREEEHYLEVAAKYDACYSETHQAQIPLILRNLCLSPDDALVEVGGGTGTLLAAVCREANLKRPGVCVDPSASMLAVATKKTNVLGVLATAEDFFSNHNDVSFNKVLMVGSIHHFSDPESVFSAMADRLPCGGKCLVITRGPSTTLPFFNKALKTFADSCQDMEGTVRQLRATGLEVTVTPEVLHLRMKKTKWYSMLRERYMSNLKMFTEDEVEAGIMELEREHFCGVLEDDIVTIKDNIVLIVACKK